MRRLAVVLAVAVGMVAPAGAGADAGAHGRSRPPASQAKRVARVVVAREVTAHDLPRVRFYSCLPYGRRAQGCFYSYQSIAERNGSIDVTMRVSAIIVRRAPHGWEFQDDWRAGWTRLRPTGLGG